MPPKVVVTNRKLKNVELGIDISVPSHETASAPKLVKYYHVLIITRLPHFKSPTHSEEDIVQFMVPRDYESFETLQKDMQEAFPELKLPSLPRKYHLFMKDSDIEERKVAFDCLLKVLCGDQEKCTSSVILKFLGFDTLADRTYFKNRRDYLQRMESLKEMEKGVSAVDVEVSLFQQEHVTETLDVSKIPKTYAGNSLFEDEDGSKSSKKVISFIEDDLFPSEPKSNTDEFDKFEEHSDLLTVSESLDDVLQEVGRSKKAVSGGGAAATTKSSGGLFDEADKDVNVSGMQTDDILKYIEHNAAQDDDPDLF